MQVENKSIYYKKNELNKKMEENYAVSQAKKRQGIIYSILIVFVIISILNNQSVSVVNLFQKRPSVNVAKYIGIMLGSLFSCVVVSRIDYNIYNRRKIKILIAVSSLFILLFMLVGPGSIVKAHKGAKAWMNIGVTTIQPAEILKISFIILMATILSKGEENSASVRDTMIMSTGVALLFGVLIFLEKDLGTAIHYAAIYGFMIFMTEIPKKLIQIIVGFLMIIMSTAFYLIFKYGEKISDDYRILRIHNWLKGLIYNEYDEKLGYQVGQSLLAFGNGGFFGKSYGSGTQKYSYLPEIHTDFIIALFGEELGFLGMFFLITFFFILYNLVMGIGLNAKNRFGRYLAFGIAGYIITQFLINISVALGILPVFGIPMPIFSYGGSSIITIFIGIGIVLNINKSMFDKD